MGQFCERQNIYPLKACNHQTIQNTSPVNGFVIQQEVESNFPFIKNFGTFVFYS
jgi:hypothetical protein